MLLPDLSEELYKKDLHDQDNHNGVITYLEPDTLECEVKLALGAAQGAITVKWGAWSTLAGSLDLATLCCSSHLSGSSLC